MKKRRFPLSLIVLLPLFVVIVLTEVGIYVGAYLSLRESAYNHLVDTDKAAFSLFDGRMRESNYWDNYFNPLISKYQELGLVEMPKPNSEEEAQYKKDMASATIGYLSWNLPNDLQAFASSFLGVFYKDTNANRMVLLIKNSGLGVEGQKQGVNNRLYCGAFFPTPDFVTGSNFYGEEVHHLEMGNMLYSGYNLTDIKDPNTQESRQLWAIRGTMRNEVYATIPPFSYRFAITASIALVVLLAAAFFILNFVILRPAKKLSAAGNSYTNSLKNGGTAKFFEPSSQKYTNEVTELNDAFYYLQEAIDDYTKRILESASYEERVKADLALATRIQSSMVPSTMLEGDIFAVRGFMKPAKEVGGDLYNYFKVDDDHIAFFIGDVSGKGVPAALFMAKANTVLRMVAKDFDFNEANRLLCESNQELLFVTAFMGVLELSTGKLTYVNAGHEPVFIYHDGQYSPLEEEPNFMLGYDSEMEFIKQERILELGDRLVLYTDGVSEAMNPKGELFGKERIINTLNSVPALPSVEMYTLLMKTVHDFVDGAEQSDDACVVSLDYGKEKTLRFAASKEGLAQIAPFIDEFLEGKDFTLISTIQVIADELCSNVIFYSHTKTPIHFSLRDDGKSIVGFLIDEGVAFDPLKDKPKHDENLPGGLGIIAVNEMSDDLVYHRVAGYNVLQFTKNYSK